VRAISGVTENRLIAPGVFFLEFVLGADTKGRGEEGAVPGVGAVYGIAEVVANAGKSEERGQGEEVTRVRLLWRVEEESMLACHFWGRLCRSCWHTTAAKRKPSSRSVVSLVTTRDFYRLKRRQETQVPAIL